MSDKAEFKFAFRFSKDFIDYNMVNESIRQQNYRIGVVLVNYRNWHDTNACIKSLQKSFYRNVEIVVVDNSECSLEELKQHYDHNIYIKNVLEIDEKKIEKPLIVQMPNHGFAHAVNKGIELLRDRCDYIWILNNDTIVPPSTMAKLLETSLKTGRDVVTCKIRDFTYSTMVQYDGTKVSYVPFEEHEDIVKNATFLSGANIFIKKELFDKVGNFDEQYFLYYEDTDFHMRLLKYGAVPLYTPYTHIYHKGGASIGGWKNSPLSMYYATRNRFLFMKRHGLIFSDKEYMSFFFDFTNYLSQKNILRAMFTGMMDAMSGVTGKREKLEFFTNYKKSMEDELKLKLSLKDNTALQLYTACMNKPRDRNAFKNLLDYVFSKKEKIYEHISSIDCEE